MSAYPIRPGLTGVPRLAMSALGQKQTFLRVHMMSALPQKRTLVERFAMSALCQKRTYAVQQKWIAIRLPVGAGSKPVLMLNATPAK